MHILHLFIVSLGSIDSSCWLLLSSHPSWAHSALDLPIYCPILGILSLYLTTWSLLFVPYHSLKDWFLVDAVHFPCTLTPCIFCAYTEMDLYLGCLTSSNLLQLCTSSKPTILLPPVLLIMLQTKWQVKYYLHSTQKNTYLKCMGRSFKSSLGASSIEGLGGGLMAPIFY